MQTGMHPLVDELLDAEDLSMAFLDRHETPALCREPISRLPLREPILLTRKDTVSTAIARMVEDGRGAVLVLEAGRLVGIFTERDVLTRIAALGLDPKREEVGTHMTPNPEVLMPGDKIAFVLNRMTVGGYRHVPIVDKRGTVQNLVSVKDVVQYIVDAMPEEIYNIRPMPLHKGFKSPEGA